MRTTMDEGQDEVRLDSQRLKAIAHPLRARVLASLRTDGPATASGLAARLATNTGQTSYHLRVLADAGLIEEILERGTARERWWSSVDRSSRVEVGEVTGGDPGAVERRRWLLSEAARVQDRLYARYLDEADLYGPAWQAVAGMADWQLHLTASELDELQRTLEQVVERYMEHGTRRDADAGSAAVEPVHVQLRAFPQRSLDPS